MTLQKMKVSSRLAAGFGLLLAMLLVVGGAGLYAIYVLKQSMVRITETYNVQRALAIEMRTAQQNRALAILNLVVLNDPGLRREEQERFANGSQRYDRARDELGRMFASRTDVSAHENELYRAVLDDQQHVTPLAQQVIDLALANNIAGAVRVLVEQLRPAQRIWMERLTELSENELALTQQAAARAHAQSLAMQWLIGIAAALALLLGTLAAIAIRLSILRQLGGEPAQAQALAADIAAGDLTRRLAVDPRDTVSLMYSLETMRRRLADVVATIQASAESISGAAAQIAQGNADLSQRTEEQAASLEQTAASMDQLTSAVRQNNEHALQGSSLADASAETARQAGVVVADVVSTMERIASSSARVGEIISVIEGISFQTNILALNAAVEAARAGEQGRGFAVVASEVRALAQRSANAAKEIKELIEGSASVVRTGCELVGRAGRDMSQVVAGAHDMTGITRDIATASREQATGIEQVNIAIAQMDGMTQQNAALVEEAAAAALAMAEQARGLLSAVAVFRTAPTARPVSIDAAPAPEQIREALLLPA